MVLEQRGVRKIGIFAVASAFSSEMIAANRRVFVAAAMLTFASQIFATGRRACFGHFAVLQRSNCAPAS